MFESPGVLELPPNGLPSRIARLFRTAPAAASSCARGVRPSKALEGAARPRRTRRPLEPDLQPSRRPARPGRSLRDSAGCGALGRNCGTRARTRTSWRRARQRLGRIAESRERLPLEQGRRLGARIPSRRRSRLPARPARSSPRSPAAGKPVVVAVNDIEVGRIRLGGWRRGSPSKSGGRGARRRQPPRASLPCARGRRGEAPTARGLAGIPLRRRQDGRPRRRPRRLARKPRAPRRTGIDFYLQLAAGARLELAGVAPRGGARLDVDLACDGEPQRSGLLAGLIAGGSAASTLGLRDRAEKPDFCRLTLRAVPPASELGAAGVAVATARLVQPAATRAVEPRRRRRVAPARRPTCSSTSSTRCAPTGSAATAMRDRSLRRSTLSRARGCCSSTLVPRARGRGRRWRRCSPA